MKEFTLNLKVTIDFSRDDKNEIGIEWSAGNGQHLSDIPAELEPTVVRLMKDMSYAMPVFSCFDRFSENDALVIASAHVKFEGENEDWNLSFSTPEDKEQNHLLNGMLFNLLKNRKAFLGELKKVKGMLN